MSGGTLRAGSCCTALSLMIPCTTMWCEDNLISYNTCVLFSSTPKLATVFRTQSNRDLERRLSLSPMGRRAMGNDSTWTLTVLSHSTEVSTVTKHILKTHCNASVGDVCLAYMGALGSSGGCMAIESKAESTTGFALYPTRKMTGIPLNIAGQLDVSLQCALGQGQSDSQNTLRKATLHAFQARCREHWSLANASCYLFSTNHNAFWTMPIAF